ncbi:MAG: ThiF family adenylyltransferase [bacterium]|nr:ThiF family adenylyltransferase [bacterium]
MFTSRPTKHFHSRTLEIGGATYDLLLDGTDNFPTRYLVPATQAIFSASATSTPSIYRFEGQISVFCDPDGPCYRCLYPEPPPRMVQCSAEGAYSGIARHCRIDPASEALKLLLIGTPLVGTLLRFDALDLTFKKFELKRDPDCPLCGKHPTITEPIDYVQFCGPRMKNKLSPSQQRDDGARTLRAVKPVWFAPSCSMSAVLKNSIARLGNICTSRSPNSIFASTNSCPTKTATWSSLP